MRLHIILIEIITFEINIILRINNRLEPMSSIHKNKQY